MGLGTAITVAAIATLAVGARGLAGRIAKTKPGTGMILVREAGGFISDIDGGDAILQKSNVVAGNDTMHRELLRLLQEAGKTAGKQTAAAPISP